MFCGLSSWTWGSWNLSRFLLREGSLTLMNMATKCRLDLYMVISHYSKLTSKINECGPGNAACLPTHNGKTVHTDRVSRRLTMFIYGGPKVFFKAIPKGPS